MYPETKSKSLFRLLNQIFDLERRVDCLADGENVLRQVRRMKELFEEDFHLTYEDPTGQPFNETRTDVEAHLAGDSAEDLVIVETLKPVIRFSQRPHVVH
ncbi:MAG: hypothetical protein WCK17_16175, partial [Verrucomicrobiota bacterium]